MWAGPCLTPWALQMAVREGTFTALALGRLMAFAHSEAERWRWSRCGSGIESAGQAVNVPLVWLLSHWK